MAVNELAAMASLTTFYFKMGRRVFGIGPVSLKRQQAAVDAAMPGADIYKVFSKIRDDQSAVLDIVPKVIFTWLNDESRAEVTEEQFCEIFVNAPLHEVHAAQHALLQSWYASNGQNYRVDGSVDEKKKKQPLTWQEIIVFSLLLTGCLSMLAWLGYFLHHYGNSLTSHLGRLPDYFMALLT